MCKHLCCEHTAVSILPGWQENMPALNENQSLLNLFAPARLDWRCFRAHKELCLGRRIIFRQGVTYSALEDVRSTRNANCIWGTQNTCQRQTQVNHISDKPIGRLSFLLGWGAWEKGLSRKCFPRHEVNLSWSTLRPDFSIPYNSVVMPLQTHFGFDLFLSTPLKSRKLHKQRIVLQPRSIPGLLKAPAWPACSPRLHVNHGEQEFLHAPGTVGYRTVHQQPGSNFQGSHSALLEPTSWDNGIFSSL